MDSTSATEMLPARHVGRRMRRTEDLRLITGDAHYVGDVRVPGMLQAAVLRSGYPHARITALDVSAARGLDGVVAVYTAADVAGKVGSFVEAARLEVNRGLIDQVGPVIKECPMTVLPDGVVRWVGQPVAVVVATDRYVAEDALELIEVDYDPLPAITDPKQALEDDAPVLHPHLGDNVHTSFSIAAGDAEAALAAAPRRLQERYVMGRQVGNAMETRGVLASYDHGRGELTVWCTNARPHLVRTFISEMVGTPAESIRVIVPDMGGSFGTGMFSEEILIPYIAMDLRRPVRWIEDRRENLANTRHARDQIHTVDVGYDDAGVIAAIKDSFVFDCGAHNPYAITVAYNAAAHLRNQCRVDNYAVDCRGVLTNKAPVTPVRGAGRPEATFVMDRILDTIAHELDLDPVEVRRRNLIEPSAMPYDMGIPYRDGVRVTYDRGDFPGQLDAALELFGYTEWRERQGELREQGRCIGIGVSSYVEGSGYGPYEGAIVRIDHTGHVNVFTGAKPHGQSLETTLAQVTADQLGVAPDDVTVRTGDTSMIAYGIGTFASRSAVTAGNAVGVAARRLRDKVVAVAAELLETDPQDLDVEEGRVFARGVPQREVTFREIAAAATPGPRARLPAGMEPGLETQHYYVPPTVTFGSGTHVCAVEVDERTGHVQVLDYVTVDDCGQMLNPTIVEGQVHGGVAHGIGNGLYEEAVYDDSGQLLTTTYMDYLIPTAMEVPPIKVGHQEGFPSERNPLGVKGVGEGGAVSPPAAIANAVADALRPLDVRPTRVPLPPEMVLDLVRRARGQPPLA